MENLFTSVDLKTVLTVIGTAGAIYGAIRADIKNIYGRFDLFSKDISRIEHSANDAHKRMDDHVMQLHVKGK